MQLEKVQQRLADRKIIIELTDEASQHLAAIGYEPEYGARPLRRVIERDLLNPLARKIIEGAVPPGSLVKVTLKSGDIAFEILWDQEVNE